MIKTKIDNKVNIHKMKGNNSAYRFLFLAVFIFFSGCKLLFPEDFCYRTKINNILFINYKGPGYVGYEAKLLSNDTIETFYELQVSNNHFSFHKYTTSTLFYAIDDTTNGQFQFKNNFLGTKKDFEVFVLDSLDKRVIKTMDSLYTGSTHGYQPLNKVLFFVTRNKN